MIANKSKRKSLDYRIDGVSAGITSHGIALKIQANGEQLQRHCGHGGKKMKKRHRLIGSRDRERFKIRCLSNSFFPRLPHRHPNRRTRMIRLGDEVDGDLTNDRN
jgi:hypothetical protein